jgi:hypothetical protein
LDDIGRLKEGLLGTFWTLGSVHSGRLKTEDGLPGHIQLHNSSVVVKVQRSPGDLTDLKNAFDRTQSDQEPGPGRWLFGITEAGSVIIPSSQREARTISFGSRPEVQTYVASSVVAGVDPSVEFGPKVRELTVRLPNPEWAGLNPLSETLHTDKVRGITGADIHLRTGIPVNCGTVNGFKIEIGGGWLHRPAAKRSPTQQIVGLDVTTTTTRPRTLEEHLDVGLRIQDLMSIAYDGFLPAISARVQIEGASDARPALWNSELFEDEAPSDERRPFFMLNDLSPRALARWVNLTRRNAISADTIRVAYRARRAPSSRIVELGAAIEQLVAQAKNEARLARRPAPRWTKVPRGDSGGAPGVLARHAGAPFREFVGDPTAWARMFLEAYNRAKHDPGPVPEHLTLLTGSGQLLIATVLLNRAGRCHGASSKLLSDHRLDGLRQALHRL